MSGHVSVSEHPSLRVCAPPPTIDHASSVFSQHTAENSAQTPFCLHGNYTGSSGETICFLAPASSNKYLFDSCILFISCVLAMFYILLPRSSPSVRLLARLISLTTSPFMPFIMNATQIVQGMINNPGFNRLPDDEKSQAVHNTFLAIRHTNQSYLRSTYNRVRIQFYSSIVCVWCMSLIMLFQSTVPSFFANLIFGSLFVLLLNLRLRELLDLINAQAFDLEFLRISRAFHFIVLTVLAFKFIKVSPLLIIAFVVYSLIALICMLPITRFFLNVLNWVRPRGGTPQPPPPPRPLTPTVQAQLPQAVVFNGMLNNPHPLPSYLTSATPREIDADNDKKDRTYAQGFVVHSITTGAWTEKFRACPRIRCDIWDFINADLASSLDLPLGVVRSCFNGTPSSVACQAARAAGLPRIVTSTELRNLLSHSDIFVPFEQFDSFLQSTLDKLHKSTAGRMTRAQTRMYTTTFTTLRKKESDVFQIMRSIQQSWQSILDTLHAAKRTNDVIAQKRLARRDRPIRSSAILAESVLRDALHATSSSSSSSSSEPQPDEELLQKELDEFVQYADSLLVKSPKDKRPEPLPPVKFSAKKTARRVAKELKRFKAELNLDKDYKPTKAQGPQSWISSIINVLSSKNFHYGLHFIGLISSVVILACRSETSYRVGATLVGANSLYSLHQLWSTNTSVPLGLISHIPKVISIAKSLSSKILQLGPGLAKSISAFFHSIIQTLINFDISGTLSGLFSTSVPSTVVELDSTLPIPSPTPSPPPHDSAPLLKASPASEDLHLLSQEASQLLSAEDFLSESNIASSSGNPTKTAQSFAFVDFFNSLASSFIEMIFGTLDSKVLFNRLRAFTIGIIAVKHAKDIFINIQHLIITSCNWITVHTLGVALFDDSGIKFVKEVDRLVKLTPHVMTIIRSPISSPLEIAEAEQWSIDLRLAYFQNIHRDHKDVAMADLLRIYNAFSQVQSQFIGKLSETASRVEPVGVLLLGAPGLGKTAFLSYMIDMLHDMGVCSNLLQYHRLPDTDFEEGHKDQASYVFDEFMTVNDKEARLAHAKALLGLVNVAPRPINYASVENKGVHFDKSEFVWCTTNSTPENWKDLLAVPQALLRRFALRITPVLPGDIPVNDLGNIDWRAYAFDVVLPTDAPNAAPNRMSLHDLLGHLARARLTRMRHHTLKRNQTLDEKRGFVDNYDALKNAILLETAALPRAQGLTDSYVKERLFVKFSSSLRVECASTKPWKEILEDAVENLDNANWIPQFNLASPPEDFNDYPLAQVYATACGDNALRVVLQREYARLTTDRRTLFEKYGVYEDDKPDPIPKKYRKYCPNINMILKSMYYYASYLNPFVYGTSLLNTFLSASATIIFATCMSIAAVSVTIMVALKTILAATPTVINVQTSPSPTHAQSARDKEERIRIRKAKVISSRNAALGRTRVVKAQAHDPNFASLANSSYCYIHSSPYTPGARAVGLKERFVLTNFHMLKSLDSYETITISTHTGDYVVKVKEIIRVDDAEDDLCLLELPRTIPPFPDITHRFIKDDDLLQIGSGYCRAIHQERHPVSLEWSLDYKEPNIIAYSDEDSETYHPFGLSLPLPGIAGDCGTLVATFSNTLACRNLLGIHCAGNDTCSQYTLVTQELLSILLSEVTHSQGFAVRVTPASPQMLETQAIAAKDNLAHLLVCPPQATLVGIVSPADHIPRKSKLVPSLFYNKFGKPKREPAVMSCHDSRCKVDPLSTAYSNMIKIMIDDLPSSFQECADQIFKYVKSTSVPRRTLTLSEAVLGIGSLPPMVLDTSPGYPWTHHPDARKAQDSTKGFFVKIENGLVVLHPDLQSALDKDLEDLRNGIVPDWFFADKLKDELRPLDKIAAGKSRVFMAAPIACHIIGRMLFGSLIAASDESRMLYPGLSSCAVGTVPQDLSTQALFSQLYSEEFVVHAHDQRGFDYHQHLKHAKCVGISVNKWYNNPSDDTARLTFIVACYTSKHVSGHIVYVLDANGMPSGVFFTAHFNSWVLETCTICALHEHSKNQKKAGITSKVLAPRQIKRGIFALYYGDDSWIAIPKKLLTISGAEFFALYLSLGLEATHCVKDWPADQIVPPESITFLKRRIFKNADGHVVFALEIDHIYDMLNYIYKKYLTSASLYNSTARNMLTEIALHGRLEFTRLATTMECVFRESNMDLTIPVDFASYV